MICIQGHSKGMHISLGIPKFHGDEEFINGGDCDFANSALANGYCPVIMEQRFMCECGGGTTTFYVACVDERIKACMPSRAVCTFKDSIVGLKHCPCNYIQGIARYFDMGDLAGLVAPRKMVVFNSQLDHGFLIEGAEECINIAKKLTNSRLS